MLSLSGLTNSPSSKLRYYNDFLLRNILSDFVFCNHVVSFGICSLMWFHYENNYNNNNDLISHTKCVSHHAIQVGCACVGGLGFDGGICDIYHVLLMWLHKIINIL